MAFTNQQAATLLQQYRRQAQAFADGLRAFADEMGDSQVSEMPTVCVKANSLAVYLAEAADRYQERAKHDIQAHG